MKRIVLVVIALAIGIVLMVFNPEIVTPVNMSFLFNVVLIALVTSLILNPVTKYITTEKLREVALSNSFRKGIGHFYTKFATFHLSNGDVLRGELVGRSDSLNTFTVRTEDGELRVFPQAILGSVGTTEGEISEIFLSWEESPELASS